MQSSAGLRCLAIAIGWSQIEDLPSFQPPLDDEKNVKPPNDPQPCAIQAARQPCPAFAWNVAS